jgi:ribosome-binding ATPase YchF (GTP1/OBG family)
MFFIILSKLTDVYINTIKEKPAGIRYSQSHIHLLIKPLLPTMSEINAKKPTINQSRKYIKKNRVRVLIIDEKAYWKKDNVLYVANVNDSEIDKDNAHVVDIMGMDKVELDKMLFIVDQLSEGNEDDSRSSGDK